MCNTIGYPNLSTDEETTTTTTTAENEAKPRANKTRYQHRQFVHQWVCIRDIIDGLITCNHILKYKNISEILIKMDLWLKSKLNQKKSESSVETVTNNKSFKEKARQFVWDLMEMKYDNH